MDIIDVMDVQNWITFIHNRIVGKYISLENAVEPIDTFFFSFCRTSIAEIWLPFILGHLRGEVRWGVYPF